MPPNSLNVAPSGIVTHSSYSNDRVGGTDGDLITRNTSTDNEENPWWQVQLPSVMAIELVLVYNARDSCAKRLFHYVNCDDANPTGSFNGANQGAVIGVSSEPCSGDSCSGIQCGEIRQNEQSQVYKVSCGGASGTYVYVMLPGSMRRVNLNEVQVWTGPLPGSASPYYLLQANTCCCPASDVIGTSEECDNAFDALHISRGDPVTSSFESIPGYCSASDRGLQDRHFNTLVNSITTRSDISPVCKSAAGPMSIEWQSTYQACLAMASSCTSLDLSSNSLTGALPTQLGALTALTYW
ncbi:hypothetical protein CYMTET_48046 [Cymbomonas tetramitiformis]|uniref:Fucolectin tachylectin-4 pentraxin-1 domain-containing protein n=1 Tax=Cymbomonas tetramitiformis TaxID=36881 RepID=A0AAE0BU34_9CHLO|nr:hypothetical protein CYMTET_48046 [Cymbomonas tetramitiformis]